MLWAFKRKQLEGDLLMKKHGFTMAELLITMGIIGIVAMLTMPTFITNVNNRVSVTKLKATYAQLEDAFKQALLDEEAQSFDETAFADDSEAEETFFTRYMRVVNICNSSTDCIADEYKSIKSKSVDISDIDKFATLPNGTVLGLNFNENSGWTILLDTNGKSAPNVAGRDLFALQTDLKGNITSAGISNTKSSLVNVCVDSQTIENILYCSAYLHRNNWKMDY